MDRREAPHMGVTICTHCEHMHPASPKDSPRFAMCMKFPRKTRPEGFVTEDKWDDRGPYMYCVFINGGDCPLFEPKREEPK